MLTDLNELQKARGKTNFRCEVFPLCLLPPAGGRRTDTNWSERVNRYVGGEQRWRPHWRQVVRLEENAQSRWLVWGLSACGSLHSHHSRWPFYTVYQHSSDRASNPQSQSGSKMRNYWRISCLKAHIDTNSCRHWKLVLQLVTWLEGLSLLTPPQVWVWVEFLKLQPALGPGGVRIYNSGFFTLTIYSLSHTGTNYETVCRLMIALKCCWWLKTSPDLYSSVHVILEATSILLLLSSASCEIYWLVIFSHWSCSLMIEMCISVFHLL